MGKKTQTQEEKQAAQKELRNKKIAIVVTESEKASLEQQAKKDNRTLSSYIYLVLKEHNII